MIRFSDVHDRLLAAHGPQHWWPGESSFEIMVGALLVQRTTWGSAEKAVAALGVKGLLEPAALAAAPQDEIEACVRAAGFYRAKAARLKKMSTFVLDSGGIEALGALPTTMLRDRLLAVEGIGPETADAMLLYAFERPAAVIDAYLRRLTTRLTGGSNVADAEIRVLVLKSIESTGRLNEFHALVVAHGKSHCRQQPLCGDCSIRALCGSAPLPSRVAGAADTSARGV